MQFDDVAKKEIRMVMKNKFDDDALTWPDVPYNYTQGRIRAYEEWLASLTRS